MLSGEVVCETCFQYNLPLTAEQLSLLVSWCTSEQGVVYRELVELMDWQHELQTELETRIRERNAGGKIKHVQSLEYSQFRLHYTYFFQTSILFVSL